MKSKVLFSWSSGKDSAIALHTLLQNPAYEVAGLLTTVTGDYDRISMHGVRRALLQRQAQSIGLTLVEVVITKNTTNADYERAMRETLGRQKEQGVTGIAIGDIFLEDLRRYREENLAKLDLQAVFPIWKRDTRELSRDFLRLGFRTVLTCVDTQVLDARFSGREYDEQLLCELPEGVDPCGENGEFHSFCYAGPIFRTPIAFRRGEVVLRDNRFAFCDLIPD
jgi:uncharacterized protein (TIGR00290 family)